MGTLQLVDKSITRLERKIKDVQVDKIHISSRLHYIALLSTQRDPNNPRATFLSNKMNPSRRGKMS